MMISMNHAYPAAERAAGDTPQFRVVTLVIALLYGAILSQIPNENFFDYSNYLQYAEAPWAALLVNWAINPLSALANEPVWLGLNAGLALVFEPEGVVRAIIFLSASTVALKVLRFNPKLLPLLFLLLFMPMVIKNFLIHLRQGVAIAIFLLGWFASSRWRVPVMVLAASVHISFAFILLILGLAWTARRLHLGPDLRAVVFIGTGVSIGAGLGWLAALFGARQAQEYDFVMAEVSGFGFVLWALILALMCLEGRKYLRNYMFESGVVFFYLATYFLIEVTGRIFESGAILVFLGVFNLTSWRRNAALLVLATMALVQWGARLNQPMLGFGLG